MLSHHLCGSCLQGLVFMPLLSIQWHSEAAVSSWCLTKWVLDVLTKLWSMYDVLLYEVSFGDIGTCQPHELCPGNHCCCCCCNWCCEDEPNSSSQQQRGEEGSGTEQDQQQLSGCCWCCCYLPSTSFGPTAPTALESPELVSCLVDIEYILVILNIAGTVYNLTNMHLI